MKYTSCIIFFLFLWLSNDLMGQTASTKSETLSIDALRLQQPISGMANSRNCPKIIFSESPLKDTHASFETPDMNFGQDRYLRVRGLPEKKACKTIIQFQTDHLYANDIQRCLLRLYTVSKNHQQTLSLYAISDFTFLEDSLNWNHLPAAYMYVGSSKFINEQFIEFDITQYIKNHLRDTSMAFVVESDGKKPIDIASKESGLTPELVFDICLYDEIPMDQVAKGNYRLSVLPNQLAGKFTTELIGLPAGGFGNLMIMDDQGTIVKNYPLAIREGNILYHTLDLGDLIPGLYWAVFRKGRIMLRDQFILALGPDRIKCQVKIPESR